jgi:hypothetical protein
VGYSTVERSAGGSNATTPAGRHAAVVPECNVVKIEDISYKMVHWRVGLGVECCVVDTCSRYE